MAYAPWDPHFLESEPEIYYDKKDRYRLTEEQSAILTATVLFIFAIIMLGIHMFCPNREGYSQNENYNYDDEDVESGSSGNQNQNHNVPLQNVIRNNSENVHVHAEDNNGLPSYEEAMNLSASK